MDQDNGKKDRSPYKLSIEEILEQLDASSDGLSGQQARERYEQAGPNIIHKKKQKSLFKLMLEQLKNPVIYLLLVAIVISLIFQDYPEAIAIAIVVVLNTAIGFYMEFQARKSMKALREMDKMTARVLRDKKEKEIDAERIVPGDVILLDAGQLIPADARLIEASRLRINESALTGESVPVEKETEKIQDEVPLADRKNMVFKGTAVTMGSGKAVVTTTGMDTEMGSISEMVSRQDAEKVPLNIKLTKLSKRLVWIVIGMAAAYGILGYFTGKDIHILAQTSIAWAIAAIPEGLAIVSTIALAKGMLRLAKHKVIVKSLAAVETLGETTVILTDKTGTLTQNKLSVEEFYLDGKRIEEPAKLSPSETRFEMLLRSLILCNQAELKKDGDASGDTLEIALLRFAESLEEGLVEQYRGKYSLEEEEPFDPESMTMTTLHERDGRYYASMKGAAASVLERCARICSGEEEKELDDETRKSWLDENDSMSDEGLRTIAVAYKEMDKKGKFTTDMTLVGLVGFLDPPQPGVEEAVETCLEAGVRVVMVTGDHPGTAANIAKKVKITSEDEPLAYTGQDTEDLEDKTEEERRKMAEAKVFARTDPSQKLSILKIFQDRGDIVGMTGDGVNDAPVLKKADIGIAMGGKGTQVAKEVADMVLENDDFMSITRAIREGRIIFSNIRKFIVYQLSYHLAEIVVIAAISFTLFKLPLLPLQLLFLNLLADVFPALALGIGKGRGEVMKQNPKDPDEPILTSRNWKMISVYGVIIGVVVIGAYLFGFYILGVGDEIANNIAFFSLAFTQLVHVFNMRDPDENVFINQVTTNKYVWLAIGFCTMVLLAGYFLPGLSSILSFQPMGLHPWLVVAGAVVVSIGIIQVAKALKL